MGSMKTFDFIYRTKVFIGRHLPLRKEPTVQTRKMAYDKVSNTFCDKYEGQNDYVRFREIELLSEEIRVHKVKGDVAEAGVYLGQCSWVINRAFKGRKIYLYDTFSGFDDRDVRLEIKNDFTRESFFKQTNGFKVKNHSENEIMEYIKSKLKYPENVIFRKGWFPESAQNEKDNIFSFVMLDMDLYQPILNGLLFFYPKLAVGGYIMIHDYNNVEFKGIHDAIAEAEKQLGSLSRVPLPDQGGSVIIHKTA